MKIRVFVYGCLALGLLTSKPVYATEAQEKAILNGYEHYKIFCSNCHGPNAEGKGAVAEDMGIVPTDLTALKQTGGDTCLAERILKAVSGVHEVPQGRTQMPTFSGNLESITVYELTQFLKSIQK